ncbi:M16 family metallopeptidase [Cognatishimia activa]|uniref:M16 family metallopeptidase n=1 Tax=Cognatishimia activa TaxID=1715691 RepID=UPI00352280D2
MRFVLAAVLAIGVLPAKAEIAIQEVTSPNGIKAWLVEERSIPFVALNVWFQGGGTLDLPGKRGATNLMVGLLEEGTGDMNAQDFARKAEALAAEFDYNAYDDVVAISAQFLTENRDEAVALLRKSIVEPRFDEVSVERVRGQVLSIIQSDQKDPDHIASQTFDALAFGDHPYATSIDGSIESVSALTREDVVTAHRNALALDNVFVSAVGDISAEELGALLDTLLDGLPEQAAGLPPHAGYQLEGGQTVVEFATPQSVAIFGHEGITRDDPDFFAAYVLNQILGGSGFESRLMNEVREKRGLTYGVSSFLVAKDHGELYLGQVASANDRIGDAIDVIRSEWQRMAEEGPTQDELERTKTYLTGAYPLRFDGNGTIANILVGMQMDDLPIDYVATRNAKVEAVTMEDIKRVAKRILRPEELHFVIVGQPEG